MFTLENSMNDILADEFVRAHLSFLFPDDFVAIVPEEYRDVPAKELADKVKMPWGVPYFADGLVESANQIHEFAESDKYEFQKLWSEITPKGFFPVSDGTKDCVCLIKYVDTFKEGRPMALVVPGGAYMNVAIGGEGTRTANELEEAGYAVAILNYRVAPNRYPEPQKDLALAIKTMRHLGKQYGLKDDLLVIGYSAGGHLVASESCYPEEINQQLLADLEKNHSAIYENLKDYSAKADKVCLSYPVIDFILEQHEQSFECLTGKNEALRDKLSIDRHVTSEYPKAFVWACDDDDLVPPSNAKRMYEGLVAAGVDSMYRTYPTGGHGCDIAVGTSAEGWVNEMLEFMK